METGAEEVSWCRVKSEGSFSNTESSSSAQHAVIIHQTVRGVTVICSPHPAYGDVVAPLTCVSTPGGSLVKLGRKVTLLSSFKYLTSTLQSKHVDICRFV